MKLNRKNYKVFNLIVYCTTAGLGITGFAVIHVNTGISKIIISIGKNNAIA